jgi:hypothetical protein
MSSEVTTAASHAPEDRAALELNRLSLENQKLMLDVACARQRRRWQWLESASPLLATLAAVAGFLFGVFQYAGQQNASREAAAAQEKRELEARDRDFMKPLWEKELSLYFQAADAAATIATTGDATKRRAAEAEFWRLYQGPLVIVESKKLSGAMVRFGSCLDGSETCSEEELKSRSRAIGSSIQDTIEESAALRLSEFSQNKFQYHR